MKRRWFTGGRPGRDGARIGRVRRGRRRRDGRGDGQVTIFSLWTGSEEEAFKKVLTSSRRRRGSRPSTRRLVTSSRSSGPGSRPATRRRSFLPARIRRRARSRRGADPARGPRARPGRDQRELRRHVDRSRDVRGHGLRRRRQGQLEEHCLVQAQLIPTERLRGPADVGSTRADRPELQVEGEVPWAVGAQGRDSSWTLTDWFEQIYIRTAGGDNYDKLFSGELPFNDATVKEALEIMLQQVNDENVLRASTGLSASASRTPSPASSARIRRRRCTCSAGSRAGSPSGRTRT